MLHVQDISACIISLSKQWSQIRAHLLSKAAITIIKHRKGHAEGAETSVFFFKKTQQHTNWNTESVLWNCRHKTFFAGFIYSLQWEQNQIIYSLLKKKSNYLQLGALIAKWQRKDPLCTGTSQGKRGMEQRWETTWLMPDHSDIAKAIRLQHKRYHVVINLASNISSCPCNKVVPKLIILIHSNMLFSLAVELVIYDETHGLLLWILQQHAIINRNLTKSTM
jgi:hypothetical protein